MRRKPGDQPHNLLPLAVFNATNGGMDLDGSAPNPGSDEANGDAGYRVRGKEQSGRSMYRRIIRNYSLLGSGTAASSALLMIAGVVSARALTVRDFGALVLLQSATLFIRGLAQFATQQPVVKLGSDAQAAGDKGRLGTIIFMGLVMDAGASLLSFAVAAILIETAAGVVGLGDSNRGPAWILAASLLFSNYPGSNGTVRLFDRFGALSAIQTMCALGMLISFVVLFSIHAHLQLFAIGWAIYLALNGQLQLWFSFYLMKRNHVPLKPRNLSFASADGRSMLHYCWSTWAISSMDIIRMTGDSLLVGAIVSVESAGLYNAALKLAGVLRKFNLVHNSTIFPEFARLRASGETKAAKRLKRRLMLVSLGGGALVVAGVAVFGKLAIHILFGPRFAASYVPFVILTAAATVQLASFTPSMIVQIYIGPRRLLLLYLLAIVVFVASAIALTFAFSIVGMALSQLLFALVMILLCEMALRGRFGSEAVDDSSEHISSVD